MTDVIDSKTHAMDGERLKLFPRRDDIPVEFRAPAPVHQRHVLLDGALVPWSGPCQAVVSPIRFRDPAGALEEIELGSYPEGGKGDAEAALAAALLPRRGFCIFHGTAARFHAAVTHR
jgi:hypothetical protein